MYAATDSQEMQRIRARLCNRRRLRPQKYQFADDWERQCHYIHGLRPPFSLIGSAIVGWMLSHGGFLVVSQLKYQLPYRYDDFDETLETIAGLGIVEPTNR